MVEASSSQYLDPDGQYNATISEEEKQKRIQTFVEAASSDETVAFSKLSKYNWDINAAIDSLLNDKSAFSDFQNSLLDSNQNQSELQGQEHLTKPMDALNLDDFCDENDFDEDDFYENDSDENDFEENDSDENDFEENDEDS